MVETVAEMPIDPVPTRRPRNTRKALKEKNPSANDPVPLADDHP